MQFVLVIILVLVGAVTYFSAFIVDTRSSAIQLCLGKITRVINKAPVDPKKPGADESPGLYFMYPFICEVKQFDKRVITMDRTSNKPIATGKEKNFVDVDYYVTWRITDVEKYYRNFGGSPSPAEERIAQYVQSALQDQFTNHSLAAVISEARQKVMQAVLNVVNKNVKDDDSGLYVVDVRIKKIELETGLQAKVFQEMINEQEKIATEIRYDGKRKALQIRAEGERSKRVIIAQADQESKELRASGDASATKLYAAAYNRNRQFFEFFQSLEAYKTAFSTNDVMVLEPDSEFFKYFGSSSLGTAP